MKSNVFQLTHDPRHAQTHESALATDRQTRRKTNIPTRQSPNENKAMEYGSWGLRLRRAGGGGWGQGRGRTVGGRRSGKGRVDGMGLGRGGEYRVGRPEGAGEGAEKGKKEKGCGGRAREMKG